MNKVAIRRNSGYAEERNFISLFEGYKKTRDVGHFGAIIWFILSGKAYQPFWQGVFYNPFRNKFHCNEYRIIFSDLKKC